MKNVISDMQPVWKLLKPANMLRLWIDGIDKSRDAQGSSKTSLSMYFSAHILYISLMDLFYWVWTNQHRGEKASKQRKPTNKQNME